VGGTEEARQSFTIDSTTHSPAKEQAHTCREAQTVADDEEALGRAEEAEEDGLIFGEYLYQLLKCGDALCSKAVPSL